MSRYRALSKLLNQVSVDDWLYSTIVNPNKSKMNYIYFTILFRCYECGFVYDQLYNIHTQASGALKNLQEMHLIILRGSVPGMSMITRYGSRACEYYNCYTLTRLGLKYVQKTHLNKMFDCIYKSSKKDSVTDASELQSDHIIYLLPFERFCLRTLLGMILLALMVALIMKFGIIFGVIDDLILIWLVYLIYHHIMYSLYHKPLCSDACHNMMDANDELSESNMPAHAYATWNPKQDDRKLLIKFLIASRFFKKYLDLYAYVQDIVNYSMFN